MLKLRVSDVLSRSYGSCAGVVHDDVDTTEMSNRLIDHLIHRFGVRDITLERQHLYPKLGFDSRFHFQQFLITTGDDDEVGTSCCQGFAHLYT